MMKSKLKIAFVIFTVVVCSAVYSSTAFALSYNTLYMENPSSNLYTVDASSGAADLVGPIGISRVTDIAFNGSTLYGITFSRFLTIDTNTGGGSIVGSLGYSDMNALAIASDGTIYSAGYSSGNLIEINPATGAGTLVGNYGSGLSSSGDLIFDSNGNLFASLNRSGYSNDWLATIDLSTGTASLIGDITYNNVFGLSFKDGTLYGATSSGNLLTIDTLTGAGTVVGTNNITQWGLSNAPLSTPEPSTLLLLGSGLAGAAWVRRRFKISTS